MTRKVKNDEAKKELLRMLNWCEAQVIKLGEAEGHKGYLSGKRAGYRHVALQIKRRINDSDLTEVTTGERK